MSKTIKVGIVGGAGYTGGELIRLLINHPFVDITSIHSRSNAGQPVASVHQDLLGETSLQLTGELNDDIEVLFLCAGHGEARKFLAENKLADNTKVIDLSQDFRIQENADFGSRNFIYGLPELHRDIIRVTANVANPGCFATAIQLGLLPLAQEGLLTEINTTGITGSTGAGQSLAQTSHFSWRANNIGAYKTLSHQHLGEIMQSLRTLQPGFGLIDDESTDVLHFVPWRGDFTRGIFISSVLTCNWELNKVQELYRAFYHEQPFTHVSDETIFLKQVVNTNKCVIHLEKVGTKLIVHSAIDNLLKGASGQAVQNMNLMMGLDECAGLMLKATYF
jgi:N-acetyl-gamma-glutamyl-phosphate reductase